MAPVIRIADPAVRAAVIDAAARSLAGYSRTFDEFGGIVSRCSRKLANVIVDWELTAWLVLAYAAFIGEPEPTWLAGATDREIADRARAAGEEMRARVAAIQEAEVARG